MVEGYIQEMKNECGQLKFAFSKSWAFSYPWPSLKFTEWKKMKKYKKMTEENVNDWVGQAVCLLSTMWNWHQWERQDRTWLQGGLNKCVFVLYIEVDIWKWSDSLRCFWCFKSFHISVHIHCSLFVLSATAGCCGEMFRDWISWDNECWFFPLAGHLL